MGWSTSPSGAVAYQPERSYTANSAITLYAIWEVNATLSLASTSGTVVDGASRSIAINGSNY